MSTTTTETLTQRKIIIPEQADNHQEELASRGLTNCDYALTKKVVSEQMVVWVASLSAVLLQIAYPGVGVGVGLHSNFSYRFIERSENTAIYIYTMIFGTDEEKRKMKGYVNKKHKYVNDRKKGNTYDAFDPELQLWVAFTLYYTYVPVYEEIFGKLSDEDSEKLLQEFSILGTSLQVPLSMWPRSVAEANRYADHIINNVLEPTEPMRKTTYELQNAVAYVPWAYKPILFISVPAHWNASTERLPPRAKEIFGLQSTLLTKTLDKVGVYWLRYVYTALPMFMRSWQVNYYMGLARKLMEKGRLNV